MIFANIFAQKSKIQFGDFYLKLLLFKQKIDHIFFLGGGEVLKSYYPIPRRDSLSRAFAPIFSVTGGNDTTSPCRQGKMIIFQETQEGFQEKRHLFRPI
jgi:hypothetical protein